MARMGGIFVTVGGQTPFNRLVKVVDEWATESVRLDVFAQIGHTSWCPEKLAWTRFLDPQEFEERVRVASVVVAHAGTGSLMVALECGTPIIMMPRLASLGETRNEHQLATLSRFSDREGVYAAQDESELVRLLSRTSELEMRACVSSRVSNTLVSAIRGYIES